jgi:nicotinamide phosphoribosyltransferase
MMNYGSILLDTDAYKVSMNQQYPEGTEYVSSYVEARKNPWQQVTFFGLQHILLELARPITAEEVEFADQYWTSQGLPFNKNGWMRIVEKHDGKLPLRIQAAPEGARMKHGNVLVQVINTDPEFFWLTTWVETKMMRVWYPTTVASLSAAIRNMIKQGLELTADDPEAELPFKLHDFGARGASSVETASVGGAAHLVNFMGSDTGVALLHAMQYYSAPMEGTAMSIPASEHSTITSWGRENEARAYENMLNKFGNGMLLAVVSDSYDIYNAVDNIWGEELKAQVEEMDAMLVIRPDSGDPREVPLEVIKRLDAKYGSTVNSKGYRVLNNVRVIQGDGINFSSIYDILDSIINAGYSISNIAFGMGGALLQGSDRDTLGFAMKCSAICINGEWSDVYKDPITDSSKRSKRGRLALIMKDGEYETVREDELVGNMRYPGVNRLETVFEDGKVLAAPSWTEVIARARASK